MENCEFWSSEGRYRPPFASSFRWLAANSLLSPNREYDFQNQGSLTCQNRETNAACSDNLGAYLIRPNFKTDEGVGSKRECDWNVTRVAPLRD
jgi:hypothetical protein